MTAKAVEPRTLIKVTLSQRDRIRENAKQENITMIDYVESLLQRGVPV